MNIRKWIGLFIKTLLLGGLTSIVVSVFAKSTHYIDVFQPFEFVNFIGVILWYMIYGFLYSIVSQAGFFAYLFIHQFGLALFRSFWSTVQLLLVGFVLFDLIYFPYLGAKGDMPLYVFILISLGMLLIGLVVAQIKSKQTNRKAFVPALFFMIVMTSIEWVPGLRTGDASFAAIMVFTLLACNIYQLLLLHRLVGRPQNENQAPVNSNKQIPVKN